VDIAHYLAMMGLKSESHITALDVQSPEIQFRTEAGVVQAVG
jgi:hypothetical protein